MINIKIYLTKYTTAVCFIEFLKLLLLQSFIKLKKKLNGQTTKTLTNKVQN